MRWRAGVELGRRRTKHCSPPEPGQRRLPPTQPPARDLLHPPVGRIALLTLKGRNEEKVKFSADYLKLELQKAVGDIKGLVIAGPAPAPLLRAETYYRYQIMLRAQRMAALSQRLAVVIRSLTLPEDVTLATDIDPVALM